MQRGDIAIRDRVHQGVVRAREALGAVELRVIEADQVADFMREDHGHRGVAHTDEAVDDGAAFRIAAGRGREVGGTGEAQDVVPLARAEQHVDDRPVGVVDDGVQSITEIGVIRVDVGGGDVPPQIRSAGERDVRGAHVGPHRDGIGHDGIGLRLGARAEGAAAIVVQGYGGRAVFEPGAVADTQWSAGVRERRGERGNRRGEPENRAQHRHFCTPPVRSRTSCLKASMSR